MRKFALISLIAYLFVAFTPLALAVEDDDSSVDWSEHKCPPEDAEEEAKDAEEEAKDAEEEAKDAEEEAEDQCGKPNDVTNLYEKGACTAEGKVITEISEVIAGTTSVDDNEIINVYKGTCCLIVSDDSDGKYSCDETRNIYADSLSHCNSIAINCEKRQWIIGSSGAGIIKVYVKQLYGWAAGVIGFIVVVTIVINGIKISVSGVSGDITASKTKILQAIAALVLLFLSGLILYTINPTFFS